LEDLKQILSNKIITNFENKSYPIASLDKLKYQIIRRKARECIKKHIADKCNRLDHRLDRYLSSGRQWQNFTKNSHSYTVRYLSSGRVKRKRCKGHEKLIEWQNKYFSMDTNMKIYFFVLHLNHSYFIFGFDLVIINFQFQRVHVL
jgi:hypothetical protein